LNDARRKFILMNFLRIEPTLIFIIISCFI